jgi:hypothetical protein
MPLYESGHCLERTVSDSLVFVFGELSVTISENYLPENYDLSSFICSNELASLPIVLEL